MTTMATRTTDAITDAVLPVRDPPLMSTNETSRRTTTPAQNEQRELVPAIIASIVAVVSLFCLLLDLSHDPLGHDANIVRPAIISRAGVIVTPSKQPGDLLATQAAPASEQGTLGQSMH